MGFFKRKETPLKKEAVENPKKGPAPLDVIAHERVITAAGFTQRALNKLKKIK